MSVGGRHDWDYPDGRWQEKKVAPDQWSFSYRSTKRRRRHAPAGSGAPFMEGAKGKLAHRRPRAGPRPNESREDAKTRTAEKTP